MPESPSKLSSYFHITSYTNPKPNSRKGEGWAGLCYPAHQFLFFIQDPFIQNSKKKPSPAKPQHQLFKHHMVSHNTQRLFFLSPFLSFFLSLLFSLFSFFLPPLLLLFLPHRCFYTKHIFLFSKNGLFIHMATKPS